VHHAVHESPETAQANQPQQLAVFVLLKHSPTLDQSFRIDHIYSIYFYFCAFAIVFSALPFLNHSIWPSLKV
jgi:hypothetical protein